MADIQRHSPYLGLVPYHEQDTPYFFGREPETQRIIDSLFAGKLILLHGESAVGKTSVLRAGVMSKLHGRSDMLAVIFDAWQFDPVAGLKAAIADAAQHIGADAASCESESLSDYAVACASQLGRRLIIILDQFEEHDIFHPQDDTLLIELSRLVRQAAVPIHLLISIRSDAFASLDRAQRYLPTLFDCRLQLEHLNREQARAAIEKPVEEYNRQRNSNGGRVSIEPSLVNAILEQTRAHKITLGMGGNAPVENHAANERHEAAWLQVVMASLWQEDTKAGGGILWLETLKHLGGAKSVVLAYVERAMQTLSLAEKGIVLRMGEQLVTPTGVPVACTARDLAVSLRVPEAQLTPTLVHLSEPEIGILQPFALPGQPTPLFYKISHPLLGMLLLDWQRRCITSEEQKQLVAQQGMRMGAQLTMGLLILATGAASAAVLFGALVRQHLMLLDAPAMALGALMAAIVGFILFRSGVWAMRPEIIVEKTNKTDRQILMDAILSLVAAIAIFMITAGIALWYGRQGQWMSSIIHTIVQRFLGQ